MECDWCPTEIDGSIIAHVGGIEYNVCTDCLNLLANHEYDKLNEKLENKYGGELGKSLKDMVEERDAECDNHDIVWHKFQLPIGDRDGYIPYCKTCKIFTSHGEEFDVNQIKGDD